MTEPVKLFRSSERSQIPTVQTPGMTRQELVAQEDSWVGIVRTEPGAASGWHHHGDYDTYVYAIAGTVRIEFGSGGSEACEAGPGDVLHIPNHAVHREVTPGTEEAVAFLVRVGRGVPVVNVDGPSS